MDGWLRGERRKNQEGVTKTDFGGLESAALAVSFYFSIAG
jgi:hypothetical protein